jgi:predicted Zn-dependent protease
MDLRLRSPLLAVVTASLFAFSCLTTQLPPISSSGASFVPLKDEARLWSQARGEEHILLGDAPIHDDPELASYLAGVVEKLTPPALAASSNFYYRVRVIEDPTLNAFSYPHGSIYLHTGLLARMENESQLATVLGHEMTHIENRHAVRHDRSARNRELGFGVAALAAQIILDEARDDAVWDYDHDKELLCVVGQILVGFGLQLAFEASVNGYGRDLEREADFGGFDKLEHAGYDLREPPKLYELLRDGRGEASGLETFFFGSHPKLAERVENAKHHLVGRTGAVGGSEATTLDTTSFERRIAPVLKIDARENIGIGRFELAASELERALALEPKDAEAHLLVGRLKLAQKDEAQEPGAKARLRDEATQSFRESVRLAPDRPAAHRELGLSAYRAEDFVTACTELAVYVGLAPDAEDAQSVRDHLLELDRSWHCASL